MRNYIGEILDVAGATTTLIPLALPALNWNGQAIGENALRTTVTAAKGASGLSAVFTYVPDARTTWAKSTYYRGRGRIPFLPFNSTTEALSTPDDPYWSLGDGLVDSAFSIVVRAKLTDTAIIRALLGKWDAAATREWLFYVNTADKLILQLWDASNGETPLRTSDAAIPMGRMITIGATYDGGGGATAANGIKLYIDGVEIVSTATNSATYVAMENQTALVRVGDTGTAAQFMDGEMQGSSSGLLFVKAQLTLANMRTVHLIHLDAQKELALERIRGRR